MNSGRSGSDIESRIAARVSTFAINAVPDRVQITAKLVLLDTVGIAAYGSHRPYISDVIRASERYGCGLNVADGTGATSLATWERHAPMLAAEANATAASSTEYYEGLQGAGMAGIHVVPAALAMAEHMGATGQATFEAIVAGYEIAGVVGDLLRPLAGDLHGHGGNHPVGVAAAVGYLLELDEKEFANALRIAANPLVVGHWGSILQGSNIRNYYSGWCVTHGMRAAILADAGIVGMDGAIERMLFETLSAEPPATEMIDAGCKRLFDEWYLDENMFKMYPTCRYTHAPLEGLTEIVTTEKVDASSIESITVYTSEFATYGDIHRPVCEVDAKYSIPYVLAALLVRGVIDVGAFDAATLRDSDLLELAERVEVVVDPEYDTRADGGEWGAAVEVEMRGGEVFRTDVRDAESGVEVSVDEVTEKFDSLVARCGLPVDGSRIRRDCLRIEDLENITSLFRP